MVYRKYFTNPSIVKASYAHCRGEAMIDALRCGEDQRNGGRIEVPALALHSKGGHVLYSVEGVWKGWVGGKGPLTAGGIENEAGYFFAEEEPEAVAGCVGRWLKESVGLSV